MVVLVSLEDPGLTIFPTHRVFRERRRAAAGEQRDDPESALERARGGSSAAGPRSSSTTGAPSWPSTGRASSTCSSSTGSAQEGLSYTADWREAVRAVDEGEAAVAVLMRPTRIEDVFEVAARGETMPQKSTYFYPKLVSGLLFHPLDA